MTIGTLLGGRGWVTEITYRGLLTREAMMGLLPHHFYAAGLAAALVVRLDLAVIAYVAAEIVSAEGLRSSPAFAIVVGDGFYGEFTKLSAALSEFGVLRSIFRPDQLLTAHEWAEDHCRANTGPLPGSLLHMRGSGFAGPRSYRTTSQGAEIQAKSQAEGLAPDPPPSIPQ
jgi:hypothetical protein